MSKPTFSIDISAGEPISLEAQAILSRLSPQGCYHESMNLRLPFGIYNVSIERICDKLRRLCTRLEQFFLEVTRVEGEPAETANLRQEIVDYIELALYAAAEHVDDLEAIASGFFKDKHHKTKNAPYRAFEIDLKAHKKFVATAANNIKHQQARIRLYSMEYQNGPNHGCLHGYFIEGVTRGQVGPSGVLHREQPIFSVTTFVWEIIVFVLLGSMSLANFLRSQTHQFAGPVKNPSVDSFTKTFVAAARLPNYTFGEQHPFERVSLSLTASSDGPLTSIDSGLYGSLLHQWMPELGLTYGRYSFGYQGDGVTKSFTLVAPKAVSLRNWGRPPIEENSTASTRNQY